MKETKLYKNYISKQKVQTLLDLQENFKYTEAKSVRRRMGENGNKNLSKYFVMKWDKMTKKDRELIKEYTKKTVLDKTIISWFLKFPISGLLDTMTTWVNKSKSDPIYFTSIALKDNQHIWIGKDRYVLNAGDAITFSIRQRHTVPKVEKEESIWLCYMCAEVK